MYWVNVYSYFLQEKYKMWHNLPEAIKSSFVTSPFLPSVKLQMLCVYTESFEQSDIHLYFSCDMENHRPGKISSMQNMSLRKREKEKKCRDGVKTELDCEHPVTHPEVWDLTSTAKKRKELSCYALTTIYSTQSKSERIMTFWSGQLLQQ